ncbi:MAG: DUF6625 family protein [Rikenellaceae bacterium]
MKKIAFIVAYIGKFGGYFPYFLTSCKYNPSVDFLFFTDDVQYLNRGGYSSNVKFIEVTFDELKSRAQRYCDFEISLEYPYKLCEYRPMYGLMFEDYLKDYDYWGHCDTDMIFGDIRKFLGDAIESGKYRRILRHGHLTLYHNDEYTNNIFREVYPDILDYKTAFQSRKLCAFDEAGGSALIWLRHHMDELYENLDYLYCFPLKYRKSFIGRGDNLLSLKYYNYKEGILTEHYIRNGESVTEERLYVHFYQRSLKIGDDITSSSFSIVPNKFVDYLGDNISYVKRFLLCYRPFYPEYYISRIMKKIKSKL